MTKKLTFKQIVSLQKGYGVTATQESINSGQCWKMEGSVGRFAMSMLEAGVCMLPLMPRIDAYGSRVPPRNVLKAGTKGTFKNAQDFWAKVYNGDFEVIESLEETFGVCDVENEVA